MENKLQLPEVTLICVDCVNYGSAIAAMQKSMEQVDFGRAIMLTDKKFDIPEIEFVVIPAIKSKLEYSRFMVKELYKYFSTAHCLVVQHDGYVLDANAWDDEFYRYDYIGSPWLYTDGRNVGNGGFSLRSHRLCRVLGEYPHFECHNNEDDVICREYRGRLEKVHFMQFAPEEIADQFAYELREPNQSTFGFHGYFHKPYKPIMVIKRTAAMGDIISIEPLIENLCEAGYSVYLDIPIEYYDLFKNYKYEIEHFSKLDIGRHHYYLVNLDMAYEVQPKKNHIQAYFETLYGHPLKNIHLRNPELYPKISPQTKLFKKYVVLNIDNRQTTHRNVYGVVWVNVVSKIKSMGYDVVQVGTNYPDVPGAIKMNCPTIGMLKLVIAGADGFIGVDSGPAHIAVAHQVPSVILFGSVNPEIIFVDQTDIMSCLTNPCPIGKQFCWHESPGTEGVECDVVAEQEPCCIHDENRILSEFKRVMQIK